MKKLSYLLFVLLLALCACEPNTPPAQIGDMPIRISLTPAIAHGYTVTSVVVTITKGDFSDQQELAITGSNAEGTFADLEVGTYAIDVNVYDEDNLIATGSGYGTVTPGETTTVHITLQFVHGGLEVVVGWGLPYEDCRRVLLVGNSHTYYNGGVDTHLQALINAVHPEWNAVIQDCTVGGYTLENHYNDANTLNTIRDGDWDLVILQEMSSRPMNDPDLFYQYAEMLSSSISEAGALTGFYMTWAWRNNPEMYMPVRDAYYYIGAFLDALVAPAGVAFYNARQLHDCPDLIATDNYHPSLYGTYLVSCVMLAEIWNVNPVGNSYIPLGITADEALFLQQVAWDTVLGERSLLVR
jgi:hypothetical protein